MEYPSHELLITCIENMGNAVSMDEGFYKKLIAEYRTLKQRVDINVNDYNNSILAAKKLASLLAELLQFGDNLTDQQRVMIGNALVNFKPQHEEDYNV